MPDYRLKYHLMPVTGWLNDPNGLSFYKGRYQIFYQEDEKDCTGKLKCWGHYSTADFQHYRKEADALLPDTEDDKDGCYSGSAIEYKNQLHVFYTGNVKHAGNYDYIHEGREHNLMHAVSDDGIHFTEKKKLLSNREYPKDLTLHVRDPKVFEMDGSFHLVMGARTNEDHGCILEYRSSDLIHWKLEKRLVPSNVNGYMLECPDVLFFKDNAFLMCSPQGLPKIEGMYQNVYDTGTYEVHGDVLSNYRSLDYGFDFYAAQTMHAGNRIILIGWMGMPDAQYTNPTADENWMHALTMPREVTYDGVLRQYPIQEILGLRRNECIHKENDFICSKASCITFSSEGCFLLKMNDISLSFRNGTVTLDMGNSGSGRKARTFTADSIDDVSVFIDTSCMEIFFNHGEYCMTARYYDNKNDIHTITEGIKETVSYDMEPFVIEKGSL